MRTDDDSKILARMADDVRDFAAMRQRKGKSREVDSQIASTLWEYWGCERFDWFVAEMVEVIAGVNDISGTGDTGGIGGTRGKGVGSTGDTGGIGSTRGKGGVGSTGGTGGIGTTGGKGGKGDYHGTRLANAVMNLVEVMDWGEQDWRGQGSSASTGEGRASSASTGEGKGAPTSVPTGEEIGWHQDEETGLWYRVSGAPGKLLLETLQKMVRYGKEPDRKRRREDDM